MGKEKHEAVRLMKKEASDERKKEKEDARTCVDIVVYNAVHWRVVDGGENAGRQYCRCEAGNGGKKAVGENIGQYIMAACFY